MKNRNKQKIELEGRNTQRNNSEKNSKSKKDFTRV